MWNDNKFDELLIKTSRKAKNNKNLFELVSVTIILYKKSLLLMQIFQLSQAPCYT